MHIQSDLIRTCTSTIKFLPGCLSVSAIIACRHEKKHKISPQYLFPQNLNSSLSFFFTVVPLKSEQQLSRPLQLPSLVSTFFPFSRWMEKRHLATEVTSALSNLHLASDQKSIPSPMLSSLLLRKDFSFLNKESLERCFTWFYWSWCLIRL